MRKFVNTFDVSSFDIDMNQLISCFLFLIPICSCDGQIQALKVVKLEYVSSEQ